MQILRADSTIKAAAAATSEANSLKAKMVKAAADSRRLANEAKAAHLSFLAAQRAAQVMKAKASSIVQQVTLTKSVAQAAAAKKASDDSSALLAAARKNLADKSVYLQNLIAASAKARAARAAAVATYAADHQAAVLDAAKVR
jgi:hypothetical protein